MAPTVISPREAPSPPPQWSRRGHGATRSTRGCSTPMETTTTPSTPMLCEEQSRLVLRGADAKRGGHAYVAASPIQLPDAGRAQPPRGVAAAAAAAAAAASDESPSTRGRSILGGRWILALVTGAALPNGSNGGVSSIDASPIAWHRHQPRLATVDGHGRVLVHNDPAGLVPKPAAVLRHSAHGGARALAWRPHAGATLAVGGAHGVCVWTHEPASGAGKLEASDGVAGARAVGGGRGRIGGVPEWRLRRLRGVDDDPGGECDGDPYRAAAPGAATRAAAFVRRTVHRAFRLGASAIVGRWSSRTAERASEFKGAGFPWAYDTLAWSPCGRLLAAGSSTRRAVSLWDLSTEACTPIASGVAGVSLLLWSPCGSYLFSAAPGGGFTLWETEGWTNAYWDTGGMTVCAAAWGPAASGGARDGSGARDVSPVLLVTTAGSSGQVMAVHLRGAPSLVAQLLPLDLPRLSSEEADAPAAGGEGKVAKNPNPVDIVGMSWDPSGKRLAVVLNSAPASAGGGGDADSDDAHAPGRVVLYSIRTHPVVSASLLGYVRAGGMEDASGAGNLSRGGAARAVALSGPGGGVVEGRDGGASGRPAASTLAVCWEGGGVSVCPLYFPL